MDFYEYQKKARTTAIYNDKYSVMYPALGLAGETGELCNKVSKIYRDYDGKIPEELRKKLYFELGDVLWFLANLSTDLGYDLVDVATANLTKLAIRQKEDKIKGEGDNR